MDTTLEDRMTHLEEQFCELRSQVLGLVPRSKDWRKSVGLIPDDELSRSAEKLGREWREKANHEES